MNEEESLRKITSWVEELIWTELTLIEKKDISKWHKEFYQRQKNEKDEILKRLQNGEGAKAVMKSTWGLISAFGDTINNFLKCYIPLEELTEAVSYLRKDRDNFAGEQRERYNYFVKRLNEGRDFYIKL
ncbi:hypothetical protein J4474_00760 [Candidatus Pacearchaeota archaeon]|nr:hypothetical protein [Candidatus Pacearchaeota archaeon]